MKILLSKENLLQYALLKKELFFHFLFCLQKIFPLDFSPDFFVILFCEKFFLNPKKFRLLTYLFYLQQKYPAYYLCSTLYNGPTICIFAGALRLNQSLNSEPENELDPALPEAVTEFTLPPAKSTLTETSETLLYGVIFLARSSDFTRSSFQTSP